MHDALLVKEAVFVSIPTVIVIVQRAFCVPTTVASCLHLPHELSKTATNEETATGGDQEPKQQLHYRYKPVLL